MYERLDNCAHFVILSTKKRGDLIPYWLIPYPWSEFTFGLMKITGRESQGCIKSDLFLAHSSSSSALKTVSDY